MTSIDPESQPTKTTTPGKASRRSKWVKVAGVLLIAIGLFIADPFIRPYIDLVLTPPARKVKEEAKIAEDRIFIPSIKLDAPLFDDISKLNYGIVFPHENNLGKKTNTVVEGHNVSAHKIASGPLFSLLHMVKKGDKVRLHYQGQEYVYLVSRKKTVKAGKKDDFTQPTDDERLTLITCYPPLSTAKRLIVIAKPDPDYY